MNEPHDPELDDLLARVPDAEPPVDLAPKIMASLRERDPATNLSSSSVYGTTTQHPGNREWRRTTMTQKTTGGAATLTASVGITELI